MQLLQQDIEGLRQADCLRLDELERVICLYKCTDETMAYKISRIEACSAEKVNSLFRMIDLVVL